MTYVPPDRPESSAEPLEQTQHLEVASAALAYQPEEAAPVDPFAGPPAPPVGYAEQAAPPRDRVIFQFVWEGILLLLALNALFLVYRREDELFGDEFGTLWSALDAHALYLTPILLGALAIGLSLRLGAVNLAVPSVALVAAWAPPVDANLWLHLAYLAAAAVVAGLLYALLVAAFRVPPWFAGLAIGVAVFASLPLLDRLAAWRELGEIAAWEQDNGLYIFGGAVVLAVAGGLLGLLPGLRDAFSNVKSVADGDAERSVPAVFLLIGGTVLSMLLAAGAGFLMAVYELRLTTESTSLAFGPYSIGPGSADLQLLAFGAVLLAGTSLWGRRGGVLGTVFAVVGLWAGLVLWGQAIENAGEGSWQADYFPAMLAGLLLVGIFVSFGLDRLGRPKDPTDDDLDDTTETPVFDPNAGLFEPTLPDATTAER
ncbi:hypothetical protein AB0B28_04295 [Glycomyces sp. NPDC046736]|uniref:hypothetical protein n=1 Tax=Glycomyces sp. NPDC046736 TaxID=3155615 RepID=UPI0033C8CB44